MKRKKYWMLKGITLLVGIFIIYFFSYNLLIVSVTLLALVILSSLIHLLFYISDEKEKELNN